MDQTASPLGRFSEVAALVTAISLVAAWLFVQLGIVVGNGDSTALTAAASLAIGVVLGQRATTNGAGKIANAAHIRIDKLTEAVAVAHADNPHKAATISAILADDRAPSA